MVWYLLPTVFDITVPFPSFLDLAYFTVLLFGLGVRLAIMSGAGRSGAAVLLTLWIGFEVAADVTYGHQATAGAFAHGTSWSLLWMASYTCLAALAVHPAMSDLLNGAQRRRSITLSAERVRGPTRNLRILVAEDNPITQKVAVRVLEKLGYRTDTAADGVEAVDAVSRQRYDVVLMDVQMPQMDGLEATRRIRSLSAPAADVHIIAMTASAFAEDKARCLAAGMDDYLSRPVRSEDLAAALDRAAPTIGMR